MPPLFVDKDFFARRATHTALIGFKQLIGQTMFLANDDVHEMGGKHTCDKRLTVPELQAQYPAVDYTLVENEQVAPLTRDSQCYNQSREQSQCAMVSCRNVVVVRWTSCCAL